MNNFLRGIIVGAIALAAGVYVYARLGLIDLRADQAPSAVEKSIAGTAMDESTERHAPQQKDPLPAHAGEPAGGRAPLSRQVLRLPRQSRQPRQRLRTLFYPRVPQFMKEAPDLPDHENFYIVKHGVRWTAMPAWGGVMTDSEIWQVVLVLSHFEKLPPEAIEELKKPVAAAPAR